MLCIEWFSLEKKNEKIRNGNVDHVIGFVYKNNWFESVKARTLLLLYLFLDNKTES